MEFSEEWKSIFPIGSVFEAPLLISNPSSKAILGPLFFNPNPQTLTKLFNSPSLSPPLLNPPPSPSNLSLSRFLTTSTSHDSPILLSVASSITSSFGPQHQNDAASLLAPNRLQFLKCPNSHSVILFFSTGCIHDQVGFLLLSVKDKSLVAVGDRMGGVLTARKHLNQRIMRILVNPVVDLDSPQSPVVVITVGYLLVCTMYSAHWFCVKIGEISDGPVLDYMGCKIFRTCSIAGACWSPHLPEECVVLLENGALFLFDLQSDIFNTCFSGNRLQVKWDDPGNSGNCEWLGCEFSWHPRILIVARSDATFLVDWRYGKFNVTCLAKINMFGVYAPVEKERFLAISKAVSDPFHFVLVSDSMLVLCDVRRPLMPVLQWKHWLDKPCYVDVFKLSELRANSRDNTHEWATGSGFGIILGSFWNCEFSLFCYGPPIAPRGSIASAISEISKSVYAWELPSNLLLSGHECRCGSCLVREEFLKDALPGWIDWHQKKDILLGFGILTIDLSSLLFEPDEFGGFTLIRLMSSGQLESQRYYASWGLARKSEIARRDPLRNAEDNLLYSTGDEEYKFPRRFKYLELDYLCAYLNGNLSQVLHLNMIEYCKDPQEKKTSSLDFHELLCEKLKIGGFGQFRTSPSIGVVFDDISSPASILEVALRRIWAGLPMELLQLAFSTYSEFLDILLDQKNIALDFSAVPDLPQLPPFFLRKPSSHSTRQLHKMPRSDGLVGPVFPLPILVTLDKYHNAYPNSEKEAGGFSSEVELSIRCSEVMQAAREIAVSDSLSEYHDDETVCLANERGDVWVNSVKPKSFLLCQPVAFDCSTKDRKKDSSVYKNETFAYLISKVHVTESTRSDNVETVREELFDDLCPIDLKFDTAIMNCSSQELKAYNSLQKHVSRWQEQFNPYTGMIRNLYM